MFEYTDLAEIRYIQFSKINDYYSFIKNEESFIFNLERSRHTENPFDKIYEAKLIKLEKAYTNLYKPYLKFEFFTKAIQHFVVAKYNLNTYINIDQS
jgi:hypothetical protein